MVPIRNDTTAMIAHVRANLAEALAIAKAAEICAREGYPERAFTISLDLEELLHSSNHILQAASAMRRIANTECSQEDVASS